ncbi:MAG: sigma-70 family RNA polymerase sigma factor [Clostridiaceae bacterium]
MDDKTLLQAIKKNPEKGWEILINQYSGLMYHIVKGQIGSLGDSEVEDCVSEVFLEAYKSIKGYNSDRASLKAYLATIATRKAIDRFRKVKPILELNEEIEVKDSEEEFLDSLIKEEDKKALIDAISDLGEPDKSLILGRFWMNKTSRELGGLFELTANAVDQRISRSLKKLRLILGGEGV